LTLLNSFNWVIDYTCMNLQVSHTDIQYLDILGHGNGGTVYRFETRISASLS